MSLVLVYPGEPLDPGRCDECFAEEHAAALAAGLECSLISFEDLQVGALKLRPRLRERRVLLYRGWMLDATGYASWCELTSKQGSLPLTNLDQYLQCHHLPNWYPVCADLTAETRVFDAADDFVEGLKDEDWSGFFVKDYVKSLNTGAGSLVSRSNEIASVVAELTKYRGRIEGGVCVRKAERYRQNSEYRYFVVAGEVLCAADVPDSALVREVSQRISCPFYSVDVAVDEGGRDRLIELGDGQVSDRKHWSAEEFVAVLQKVAELGASPHYS